MKLSSIWKNSIARKLLTYVFSIYLIITISVTLTHMYFEYQNADKRVRSELVLFEHMIKPVLAEALWNFDETQVQGTISGISSGDSIIGAKVVSDSGRTWLAKYYVDKRVDGSQISGYYDKTSGELVTNTNTLANYDESLQHIIDNKPDPESFIVHQFDIFYYEADGTERNVGTACLYSSTETVFNQVKGGFVLILANAIFKTIALWILFLTIGYRYLTKPLLALTDAASEVKKGNFDIQKLDFDRKWETEIDILTNNFNYMITDLKEARADLHDTKERLKDIVDSMPSIIIGVSDKGIITDWNRHAALFTGVDIDSAIGARLEDVYPAYTTYENHVTEAIHTGVLQNINNVIIYVDNVKNHFDIVVYPILHGGVSAVIRMDNITERIQMENAMVQTEKMSSIGSLAAGMAHEINNPLGAVLQGAQNVIRRFDPNIPGNVKVAKELDLDLVRMNEYLEQRRILRFMGGIKEAGERAAKIVANLLQFSRKTNANKIACSLENILEKSIELARTDYDLKKKTDFRRVKIITDYQENLPEIHACAMEIEQVVLNLLKNAGQAMKDLDKEPQITISTKTDENFVRLDIIDNGPGMPGSVRKRIFEPFFTTKPVGEGTGLGLSVSYSIIVESHQGSMQVDSTEGKGTHFTIKLPLAYQDYQQTDQE